MSDRRRPRRRPVPAVRRDRPWTTVDLALERGITGLLGPNGAGKTTLLSILATVSEPDAGRVSVFGLDPRMAPSGCEIRRRLGYLPQELRYHRHFTVAAFLDYVAILKEITDRRRRAAGGRPGAGRHRAGRPGPVRGSGPCPAGCGSGWASPRPCSATPTC